MDLGELGLGDNTRSLQYSESIAPLNAMVLFRVSPVTTSSSISTEHCLDLIRQSVQCSGSTNLIPSKYWDGIEHNYVDSDQEHTCRSFTFLREWTNSRQPGGDAYVERDMRLVSEKEHKLAIEFAKTHESEPFVVEPII